MTDAYLSFLRRKIKLAAFDGFDVQDADINPLLKPHQRDIVKWAVKGGNRAILKGRLGQSSELNTSYFFDSLPYLKAAEHEYSMPDLFDMEAA